MLTIQLAKLILTLHCEVKFQQQSIVISVIIERADVNTLTVLVN